MVGGFFMSELWLLNPHSIKGGRKMNPHRRRRKAARKAGRKRRRAPRGQFVANPKRRRHSTSFFGNPRRRRHYQARSRSHRRRSYRRRSYRSNPPAIRSIAGELGWAAAGFMTTKVVGNMVTPMVSGIAGDQPIMRIAVKVGVAYLSAWGLASFMGQRVFMPAMLGGSIEAIQDAIKTFIAPTFPMLAANYEPLEAYYEPRYLPGPRGMGEYMGDGLSPDHDVIV